MQAKSLKSLRKSEQVSAAQVSTLNLTGCGQTLLSQLPCSDPKAFPEQHFYELLNAMLLNDHA